jgi:hypothetical protein
MEEIRTGGCSCGAVRFEARSVPKFVANCHCGDCRRATGAPFSTWVGYDSGNVSWRGERAIHDSSPTVMRGYCAVCGTPLSYSGKKWTGETHLLIGTFDDAGGLVPSSDAFASEKLPWVQLVPEGN